MEFRIDFQAQVCHVIVDADGEFSLRSVLRQFVINSLDLVRLRIELKP